MNKYLKAVVLLSKVNINTNLGDRIIVEFTELVEKTFKLSGINCYIRWCVTGLEGYLKSIIDAGKDIYSPDDKKFNEDYLLDLLIAFIRIVLDKKSLETAKYMLE